LQKNYNFFSAVISVYNQILTMTLKSQLLRILILRIANSNNKRIEYFFALFYASRRCRARRGGRERERERERERKRETETVQCGARAGHRIEKVECLLE